MGHINKNLILCSIRQRLLESGGSFKGDKWEGMQKVLLLPYFKLLS